MCKNLIIFRSYFEAYGHFCKPLCRELEMPQMAFDILMFLADNPDACTAKDISSQCGYKENILSVNINKLVNEGYLERHPVEGDRRKVRLECTKKAAPVIEQGRRYQERFLSMITEGFAEGDAEAWQRCLDVICKNACRIMRMDVTGEGICKP